SFEVDEEERLVLAVIKLGNVDRTAERAAGIGLAIAIAAAGLEETMRVEHRLIGHVIVEAAVHLIGAALGGEVEHAAEAAGVLRGEVAGLQRELADGFHA